MPVYKRKRELDINIILTADLAEKGLLKEFAFFLYFKSKYRNSCIFDYSQKSVSEKFDLSRPIVKKYVDKLLKLGWCEMHHGNLIFKKLKNIDTFYHKRIYRLRVSQRGGVKGVLRTLRLLVLKNKQISFDSLKQLKLDLSTPSNLGVLKRAKKLVKKIGVVPEKLPSQEDRLRISMRKFAKMFGCSQGMAYNIIRDFKENGDIVCIPGGNVRLKKAKCPYLVRNFLRQTKGTFYINGGIYKPQCNEYVVD